MIAIGQDWRCKCGLEWTVINIYRADDEALLAPGRGYCRRVSFKELGGKYELVVTASPRGAGGGGVG